MTIEGKDAQAANEILQVKLDFQKALDYVDIQFSLDADIAMLRSDLASGLKGAMETNRVQELLAEVNKVVSEHSSVMDQESLPEPFVQAVQGFSARLAELNGLKINHASIQGLVLFYLRATEKFADESCGVLIDCCEVCAP